MPPNLCPTRKAIFTGIQLLRQEQQHHELREHYLAAADQGCYVCGIIVRSEGWKSIDPGSPFKSVWYLSPLANRPPGWLKLVTDAAWEDDDDDKSVSVSSSEVAALNDAAPKLDFPVFPASGTEAAGGFALPKPPMWSFLVQPLVG